MFKLTGKKVWVTGHRGMVGSALIRRLKLEGVELQVLDRRTCDLRHGQHVRLWAETFKPDVVIVAAATVGGIEANRSRPAEFLYDNLAIATSVIDASYRAGAQKLLFLGSSCIYPREAEQPIREKSLLTGPLEPTNQWYAIAKIAGVKLCEAYRQQYGCNFISAMPTNLYGPGDRFDEETGHVIPALMVRMHRAKINNDPEIEVWGSGHPLREFLHVNDLASACVHILKHYTVSNESAPWVNVGSGTELTIVELAEIIKDVVGFTGRLYFNSEFPDGTPRKLLDTTRLKELGWQPQIELRSGLSETYTWFLMQEEN